MPEPVETKLNCGHTALFYPAANLGDQVFCQVCRDWHIVIGGTTTADLRQIQCQDCKYRRTFTVATQTARTRALTHALKYGHNVQVYDDLGQVEIVTGL